MVSEPHRRAACQCGQLSVTITGDPDFAVACHCIACQRRTGSPFGIGAYYRRDQVESIDGNEKTFDRVAESGRSLANHFCPDCGTNLYWTLEMRPDHMGIALGCFDDPHFVKPARTIWTEHQHAWIHLPDDLPAFKKATPPG